MINIISKLNSNFTILQFHRYNILILLFVLLFLNFIIKIFNLSVPISNFFINFIHSSMFHICHILIQIVETTIGWFPSICHLRIILEGIVFSFGLCYNRCLLELFRGWNRLWSLWLVFGFWGIHPAPELLLELYPNMFPPSLQC